MERITFKEFAGADPIYFGKTEGCDFYRGKEIAVIGTSHYPTFLYKLIALTIGFKIEVNVKQSPQTITRNGYAFKFMTYSPENEVLKNIQLWLIEGELEQAVGRARLLREAGAKVHLFSNFLLPQARYENFYFSFD